MASIIIVNYNGEKHLTALVESLSKQTFADFEVIVVDNASSDNSLNVIQQIIDGKVLPQQLYVLKNRRNFGFCISNNQGLKLAKGKYIVLLNNDTHVDSRWLEELVKRAESKDNPAAVVSCIINDGSALPNYGNFYDIYGAALERTTPTDENFFYGCGASLLISKEVFDKLGGLDAELFMYQDDTDLSWRLRLLNRKIVCAAHSICYHMKSAPSIEEANLSMPVWEFYFAHPRNRTRVLLKNYSSHNLVKRLPSALFIVHMRAMLLAFESKNPRYLTATFKGLLWNLRKLGSTLKERYKIQRLRMASDEEIEKHMLSYSVELLGLKLLLS
jgi:GT2 family glycosyltransferase